MKVGYCVPVIPELASFRLRVKIPSQHLGCDYAIGATGSPTFFFKNGDYKLARMLGGGIVYDVVNDHFDKDDYRQMCDVADTITCASSHMVEVIRKHTGREAIVIDDPYENEELTAACEGDLVLWFGHLANLQSLVPYGGTPNLFICSNASGGHVPWTLANEAKCLEQSAVVLLTGNNPGASTNRVVKALRAGRFVVTPGGVESWQQFKNYIWIGDVDRGIEWALNNREEACSKVTAGQRHIRKRYSPNKIGRQWTDLFELTLAQARSAKKAGSG